MNKNKIKSTWKKVWWFVWEDDSIWSWLVNIVLAFVLIKFMVYPGLGFVLGTNYPIVAVVSNSMEHKGMGFDEWWSNNNKWYVENGISEEKFSSFHLKNGFYKGDIMVLFGKKPESLDVGDVIVFKSNKPDPIIHRIVNKWEEDGEYYFKTKGDNNQDSIKNSLVDETKISKDMLVGKAVLKVPLLGYIKIIFVEVLKLTGIVK
ncbi:signal peptidase I [Candidatus Woesearchaeota archaeon]|nr:signal peptidase I [Candidatus Woesearchaeota archaeon]